MTGVSEFGIVLVIACHSLKASGKIASVPEQVGCQRALTNLPMFKPILRTSKPAGLALPVAQERSPIGSETKRPLQVPND